MQTRSVYVPLSESAIQALVRLAARQRREPKHQAALILERYLIRRGLIDDPSGAGQSVARDKSEASSVSNLAGSGAAS